MARKSLTKTVAITMALLIALGAALSYVWLSAASHRSAGSRAASAQASAPAPVQLVWQVAALAGDGVSGLRDGARAQARFADPFGLALDRAGNLYVADAGANNRIRKLGPDGIASTLAGGAEGFADGVGVAAAFNTPSGLAIDAAGNLYVADTGNNAIRKITPLGAVSTLAGDGKAGYRDGAPGQAQFNGPLGVAVDGLGNVYVADTYNDRIRKIAPDGQVSTLAGGAHPGLRDGSGAEALFDTPCALVVDARGQLLVADTHNDVIRAVSSEGVVTTPTRAGTEAQPVTMHNPIGLALGPDGQLYIGEAGHGRILQLAPTGQLRGLSGVGIDIAVGDATSVRFQRPAGIALAPDGTLYVSDASRYVVRKLSGVPARAGMPADAAAQTGGALPVGASATSGVAPLALPAARAPLTYPWPLKPQHKWHEIVGTMGEVRGSYDGESRDHFHRGVDVQAALGAPVLAVADEKVSSPLPNWGYGQLNEGLHIDTLSYIHMRVGRTANDVSVDPTRFIVQIDDDGKRVRVKRGTRFHVGDVLGTVNKMYHVHLDLSRGGADLNPLTLAFDGYRDLVAPHINGIAVFDRDGRPVAGKRAGRLLLARASGDFSIVVDAYDQMDGNVARRRLGLYRAGYQILRSDGTPLPGYEQALVNVEFNSLPPDSESVKLAYAASSGDTVHGNATTRFLYVVSNAVRDGHASNVGWHAADLVPGDYIIRILAADFAGNEALSGRDLPVTLQ